VAYDCTMTAPILSAEIRIAARAPEGAVRDAC
jgi:hypothetical protein